MVDRWFGEIEPSSNINQDPEPQPTALENSSNDKSYGNGCCISFLANYNPHLLRRGGFFGLHSGAQWASVS